MRLRCAIIEDLRPDAQVLERALLAASAHSCRLQCTLYASGSEFLRRGALSEQDVIFLDICMPGLDGIETARRLRGEDPRIPIVFVTSSEEYVWDALPLHPFDYLRKPYDDARVRKLLDDLLAALGRPEPELELRVARQLIALPQDPLRPGSEPLCQRLHR